VVTVFDLAPHGGGLFVAMEFVDGQDLGHWLASDRTWAEVLRVLVEAGRGLAAAHQQGACRYRSRRRRCTRATGRPFRPRRSGCRARVRLFHRSRRRGRGQGQRGRGYASCQEA
jgi:hypothetical protein